jgi:hypothetical protein
VSERWVFSPIAAQNGWRIVNEGIGGGGPVAILPPPTYDPNLEFNHGHRWTAKDEEFPPTIIYRRDEKEWVTPTIGWMRQALYDPRLDPNWWLWPNMLGNLGICVYEKRWVNDRDQGTTWYVGYIDVVTGEVRLWDGDESKLQDFADNYPFRGAMITWGNDPDVQQTT